MSIVVLSVLLVISFIVIGAYVPFLGGVIAASATYFFLPVETLTAMKIVYVAVAFVAGWAVAEIFRSIRKSPGGSSSGSSDSGGFFGFAGDGGSCGDGGGGGDGGC